LISLKKAKNKIVCEVQGQEPDYLSGEVSRKLTLSRNRGSHTNLFVAKKY